MTALLLDTSKETAFVAVALGKKIVASRIFVHENRLSETLFDAIEKVFQESGFTPKDLNYIAVGVGPGSYTGTRVGVATAKGLSYACSLPLIPFCSLIAFIAPEEGHFMCAMQAKSGDYYTLAGEVLRGELVYKQPQGLAPKEENVYVVKEGCPVYPETVLLYTSNLYERRSFGSTQIIYLYNYPSIAYT